MSVHTVSWVLRHSDARLGARCVLIVLADHAAGDGSGAWPSLETIAREARMSKRQAQRCLRSLERGGAIVAAGRSKTGTTVYQVVMKGGDNLTLPDTTRGMTFTAEKVSEMSPEPSLTVLKGDSLRSSPGEGRPRDEIWDQLEAELGRPLTRNERSKRNGVVKQLREVGATSAQVAERCAAFRAGWPAATLTDTGLVNQWTTLATLAPARRGVSASDVLRGET